MTDKTLVQPSSAEDEIDLTSLVETLWNGRKAIVISVVVFAVLGVFVAIFSPVEYTARAIMVPQIQSKTSGLGGLSSLAAMAGFNLDALQSASAELSPMVYPQIVQSIPFQKKIMYTPLTWNNLPKRVNLIDYYEKYYRPTPLDLVKKYTLGLPGVILNAFKGNSTPNRAYGIEGDTLPTLTIKEKDMQKTLTKNLSLVVNSKEGYITITGVASEALAAAQMTENAQKLLQEQVTEFKIDKARQNLAFVQNLFNEKEKEFEEAQSRLAQFRDRNLNLGPSMAKTEEEKLQSQYQLAFSVYSEVAKQLENAKIKVKEDTPIFSIIEPTSIPSEKSKPNKPMIVFIWILLGGILGIGLIFGRHYYQSIREKWKANWE